MEEALMAGLNRWLRDEREFERQLAAAKQKQIARQQFERRSLEGAGRVRMEVDPVVYHYWGQRLGYQCWKDKQFLREFERDNPEVRVRCGGTRMQVGWLGKGGKGETGKRRDGETGKGRNGEREKRGIGETGMGIEERTGRRFVKVYAN